MTNPRNRYFLALGVAATAGLWLLGAVPARLDAGRRPKVDHILEPIRGLSPETSRQMPAPEPLAGHGDGKSRTLQDQPELAQLDAFEAALRVRLQADPAYSEYSACLERGERCDAAFSSLVYSVLYSSVLADIEANAFKLPTPGTPEAVRAAATLVDLVASTQDPVKRTMALVLLNRVDSLAVRELPTNAYEGLSNLSLVEQQLLLERHAFIPLPSAEVATEVAALGRMTNDSRALSAAVLALGHASTDSELAGLLSDIGVESETRRELVRVLSLCAGDCPRTIQYLIDTKQSADRAVLERAVSSCPESKVESLRNVVRELSSGKILLPMSQG